MPDARTIIDGDPGTRWTNDTDRPWYQLVCGLINTCGICYQYHLKIARYWPVPIHHGCRCRIVVVKMGQTAPHPFCDYQKLVKSLDPPEQAKVMGAGLFRLWTKGVISWEDAVQPGRIRSLREVVSLRRLTIKAMIRAGVSPSVAEQAYASVHTPDHEIAEQERRRLIDRIMQAGVPHETLVRQLGERLASRVGIAEGPSYTTRQGVVLPGIRSQALAHPEHVRRSHAEELATLLTATGAQRVAMRAAPPLSERNRAIVAAELGPDAARNVAAFLATVDDRVRRGLPVSDEINRIYRRYR